MATKEIFIGDTSDPPPTRRQLKVFVRILKSLCPTYSQDTSFKVNIRNKEIVIGDSVYWWD